MHHLGPRLIVIVDHDFEKEWNLYLTGYEGTEIRSLADIVEFNKQHPNEALPLGKFTDRLY